MALNAEDSDVVEEAVDLDQIKEDAASDVGESPNELEGDIASDEFKEEIILDDDGSSDELEEEIVLDDDDSLDELKEEILDDDSSDELPCPDYLKESPNALAHLEMFLEMKKASQLKAARAKLRRDLDDVDRELQTKEKQIIKLRRRTSELAKANAKLNRKLKSTGILLQASMLNELKLELKIEDEKKKKKIAQKLADRRRKKMKELVENRRAESKMEKYVCRLKEKLIDLRKELVTERTKQRANTYNPVKNPYNSKEGAKRKNSLNRSIRQFTQKLKDTEARMNQGVRQDDVY